MTKEATPQSAVTDQGAVTEKIPAMNNETITHRNTFRYIKAPAGNVQSLAARRYQQADPRQSGIRLSSDYPIHLQTSTLRIVCGVKVNSGRKVGFVILGGLR